MNRRLTLSRDAVIGGVAAGVANWLNADPALVRIAWALLVPLTGGAALLAYVVGWVVIPEEPAAAAPGAAEPTVPDEPAAAAEIRPQGTPREDRTALVIGGGLVLLGLWFLVREYVPAIRWELVWPIVLVVVGVAVLVTASRRR